VEATLGKRWSSGYEDIAHSKLVILWGHNPVSTAPHFLPFLRKAQAAGSRLVVIDPRRTPSANGAERHLAPLPAPAGSLAMGLAHAADREGLRAEPWPAAHALGWPASRPALADFPPEFVARRCGLRPEDVIDLAHLYGTVRPGLIKTAD